MKYRAIFAGLMVAVLPASSLAAELVIYDGNLDTAKSVMERAESVSGGREFRTMGSLEFPGSQDLWIAGATRVANCDMGTEITNAELGTMLTVAQQAIDDLDTEKVAELMEYHDRVLPCISETVPPEEIAKLLFWKGMFASYLKASTKDVESAFMDALAMHEVEWTFGYGPDILEQYYKMKVIVEKWREPDNSNRIAVHSQFVFEDLVIDGQRDVSQLLPGTHVVRWKVDGVWYGRSFVLPRNSVKDCVLTSELEWKTALLDGPAEGDVAGLRVVKSFLDKESGVGKVTVLSLRGEVHSGYAFFPQSMEPVMVLDLQVGGNVSTSQEHKITGSIGVFGSYIFLSRTHFGGFSIMGHINFVANLEIGVGGQASFAKWRTEDSAGAEVEVDYLLVGPVFGARYFLTRKAIVHPFAGAYVSVYIDAPPIVSVQGCFGVELGLPTVHPTLSICGGVASPGVGVAQAQLGINFK
ncbi:hypothetical protein HQ524_03700 [Candidatus Uhrbacteria bacterium]|nr:hypothetical protein [Candidatus Uhrbacteria bacterium]